MVGVAGLPSRCSGHASLRFAKFFDGRYERLLRSNPKMASRLGFRPGHPEIKNLPQGEAFYGRGGGIRTHGLFVPNEARYQAAPHPDLSIVCELNEIFSLLVFCEFGVFIQDMLCMRVPP